MKYNDLIPEFVVSNIEKSKEFYVHLLGFQIAYEREEDKFAFLVLEGIQLMLEQGGAEQLAGMVWPFGKGANFSFGMHNVEEAYRRCKSRNYPIERKLEERTFRVDDAEVSQMEFSIRDPDGYHIRVTT